MIIEHMTDLIGNTPLIKIPPYVTGLKNIDLYAKLEMMNPFGSVKDRTAWGMMKDDLEDLKKSGKTIYENSSGNTAKSLQAIANIHGLKFKLVSAFAKVQEQKEVLQIMGAQMQEIADASDCFDTTDPNDPQYLVERMAHDNPDTIYFPSQFTNEKNPEYHAATTAREIINDLEKVDFFFGGLGTTGSSLGITETLRQNNPDFKAIGITAQLNHFIPGIRNLSQMMESTLFQQDYYDRIYPLTEKDALDGMFTLIDNCAILCGPSSGANYTAAISHLKDMDAELTERRTAVFIVCDRMEWYVSYVRARRPELFGHNKVLNGLHDFSVNNPDIVPAVRVDSLDAWAERQDNLVIIDTRASKSFSLIHMPQSMNMPQDIFERWIDGRNPFSDKQTVLIVCAVGERSHYYAAYLNTLGVKAYNLEGGIMAWVDQQRKAA